VLAHEACLAQALGNLLSNVAKFCRPGVPAEARISSEACGPMVRVTVADRGIGIDAAHFDRIFQIFGRIHPESAYEGTGIGLSVVKKAVERMGGGVGVDSQPGEGSRFWFTLKRV
jgi:signal transduction histidine kinase